MRPNLQRNQTIQNRRERLQITVHQLRLHMQTIQTKIRPQLHVRYHVLLRQHFPFQLLNTFALTKR